MHAPVQLVQFLGLAVDLHAQPARRLVDQVDRLVGQEAVGDVAVGERRRGHQRAVGDAHAVVQLVLLLDAAQDADGVLNARLAHEHRLEAPRQRGVLLDMLAVLVERGGADAVQLAARELGLEQVRRIHRAVGAPGADQRVHLVDEQDDLAARALDLLQHGLQPLLELAAVLRTRHHGAEVERQQPLALQRLRHVAIDDAQREPLDDRGLAHAGLADQHRVVLRPPRQHLDGAADFLVAPDHRVELAFARHRRHVAGVFLQRVEVRLGVLAGHAPPLADVVDRLVERLRRGTRGAQGARGRPVASGERHQQAVLRDILIARLLRRPLCAVEDAHEAGRRLRLRRPAAGHFRELRELGLHRLARRAVVGAGGTDQPRRRPLLVIEQGLQQMLGRELRVEFADRDRLRGLNEPARAFGKLFNVHRCVPVQATGRPRPVHRRREATPWPSDGR